MHPFAAVSLLKSEGMQWKGDLSLYLPVCGANGQNLAHLPLGGLPWPVVFLNFTTIFDLLQKESDQYITHTDGPGNHWSFQLTSLLKEIENVDVVLLAESSKSRLGTTTSSKPQLVLRCMMLRCTWAAGSQSLAAHSELAMKQAALSFPACASPPGTTNRSLCTVYAHWLMMQSPQAGTNRLMFANILILMCKERSSREESIQHPMMLLVSSQYCRNTELFEYYLHLSRWNCSELTALKRKKTENERICQ